VLASGIMSLMLIWRHKSNIQNLLAGKEAKIGKRGEAR
jgi:glycerol-3-phosphate acyltransferase PlsY